MDSGFISEYACVPVTFVCNAVVKLSLMKAGCCQCQLVVGNFAKKPFATVIDLNNKRLWPIYLRRSTHFGPHDSAILLVISILIKPVFQDIRKKQVYELKYTNLKCQNSIGPVVLYV